MKWLNSTKAAENSALLATIFGLGGAVQYALHHMNSDEFCAAKRLYDQIPFSAEPAIIGFIENAVEKSGNEVA